MIFVFIGNYLDNTSNCIVSKFCQCKYIEDVYYVQLVSYVKSTELYFIIYIVGLQGPFNIK